MAWFFVARREGCRGMNDDLSARRWYGGVEGQGQQVSTGDAGWRLVQLGRVPAEIKYLPVRPVCEVVGFKDQEDPLAVKSDRPCRHILSISRVRFPFLPQLRSFRWLLMKL